MAETKKQKKIKKVMGEFKDEKLKGRDDKTITNPKQAIAIALSQAEKMAKGGAKPDPKVGTGKKGCCTIEYLLRLFAQPCLVEKFLGHNFPLERLGGG